MIDLTPLDVRNKRGDFKKGMRGYDPQEVDVFLELVAERLEALVRENIQLRDRTQSLQEQVKAQSGREQAVQDALVTAQELRKDIREQSQKEADHVVREAETEARRMIAEAEAEVRSRLHGVERKIEQARDSLEEMERRRQRFLQEFRGLLQRELDVVEVEEERIPHEDRTVELDLGGGAASSRVVDEAPGADASPAAEGFPGAEGPQTGEDSPGDGAPPERPAAGEELSSAEGQPPEGPSAAQGSPPVEGSPAVEEPPAAGGLATAEPSSAHGGSQTDEDPPREGRSQADEPVAGEAYETKLDQDVGELAERGEEAKEEAGDPPSSLELELMAGVVPDDAEEGQPRFPEVPDLETVLAEAGMDDSGGDEVDPSLAEEISPPPAEPRPADHDGRRPEDRLAFFDKDKKGRRG